MFLCLLVFQLHNRLHVIVGLFVALRPRCGTCSSPATPTSSVPSMTAATAGYSQAAQGAGTMNWLDYLLLFSAMGLVTYPPRCLPLLYLAQPQAASAVLDLGQGAGLDHAHRVGQVGPLGVLVEGQGVVAGDESWAGGGAGGSPAPAAPAGGSRRDLGCRSWLRAARRRRGCGRALGRAGGVRKNRAQKYHKRGCAGRRGAGRVPGGGTSSAPGGRLSGRGG